MTSTEPLRTALYLRISEDRRDGAGVERQEKECRELADRLGWHVTAVFTDNDTSAYNGRPRPGYGTLLDSIRSGQTEAVVCWHSDRLHRQPKELEPYIELCDKHGVQNAAVRAGKVDLTTASGQLNARMLGAVAYFESQHKAERIRSAHRQIAENGQFHGGMRPFGYEPDGVAVREEEAAEIRRVAQAVICGQSLRSLALELNERGMSSVTGVRWSSARLRQTLLRPRMAGLREHHGKIYQACWKPILSRETWEAVKAILEDPKRRSGGGGRRGPIPTALGTGLYVCGVCNEPRLRLGRTAASTPRYRCANADLTPGQGHVARRADTLDAYVEDVLLRKISRPGVVEAMCAVIDTDDAELAGLRAEQVTIRPRLNKAANRYAANEIDDEQFAIVSKTLRDRDNEITAMLTAANMRSPLDVLLGAESVQQMWDDVLTMGQKRAILAEVLTVTVKSTGRSGGRFAGGGYFNPEAVDIKLTERAQACLGEDAVA